MKSFFEQFEELFKNKKDKKFFVTIEYALKTLDNIFKVFMPKSGGIFTGNVDIKNHNFQLHTPEIIF